MTIKNAKVKEAQEVWKAPDGQRTLYTITVDTEHGEVALKTWSNQISKVGWTGDLETYEKEGKNGLETFAKQPLKEGGFGGGAKGKTPIDTRTMYISYAKDVAVALIKTTILPHEMDGQFNAEFNAAMAYIIKGGDMLQNGEVVEIAPKKAPVEERDETDVPTEDELNEIFPE